MVGVSMGMGANTSALVFGGGAKTYNVSRLNGSIVPSGKGRNVRFGELLNPPR